MRKVIGEALWKVDNALMEAAQFIGDVGFRIYHGFPPPDIPEPDTEEVHEYELTMGVLCTEAQLDEIHDQVMDVLCGGIGEGPFHRCSRSAWIFSSMKDIDE